MNTPIRTAINLILMLMTTILAFSGCEDDTEPTKWVDLRYDVPQDSYYIDKDGVQTVTIRVKSTERWEIFGTPGTDWYTISPDSGEPGNIDTVVIRCSPNASLDDRSDVITIKSDYWVGKEFTITQKGSAFLDYQTPDTIIIEGASITLDILSNQDWRAEITSGASWLNITDGAIGNGNSSVVLQAEANTGEQRTGEVSLYDRNGDFVHTVLVTQTGVLLSPALPDDAAFYMLYHEQQQLRIPVESNSLWTVAKKTPDEEIWYDIEGGPQFEGSHELIINVSEYAEGGGASVRTGTLLLSSVSEEGITPVVKEIRFKQASPDRNRTQTFDGKLLNKDGLRSDDGQPVGRYTFYLAPYTANDCIYLYFFWQKEGTSFAELRFWLNTDFAKNKTELSCMPYCNDVNKWQNNLLVPVDNTKPVKIALDIRESEPDAGGNTWIYSEWWLNDKMIAHATSDGIADKDGVSDTWKMPFSNISAGGYFKIWAFKGSATLDKWEYTSPVVWGE